MVTNVGISANKNPYHVAGPSPEVCCVFLVTLKMLEWLEAGIAFVQRFAGGGAKLAGEPRVG